MRAGMMALNFACKLANLPVQSSWQTVYHCVGRAVSQHKCTRVKTEFLWTTAN